MASVLAIDGSYRDDGIIDQAVSAAATAVARAGGDVQVVRLRDYPIEFCRNCRECMQVPGSAPGRCVQGDSMERLVAKIEAADALILASPTNVYTVTAIFKRFMERLAVYAYWPWGAPAPKARRTEATKKALVITSSAAPAWIGRFAFSSLRQLRATAKMVGAKPVGIYIGLVPTVSNPRLRTADAGRIERAARGLV